MSVNVKKVALFIILLLSLLLASSCAPVRLDTGEQKPLIDLKDCFYWAPCSEESTIEEAESLAFTKFSTFGMANIRRVAGTNQKYVWLKAVFEVPEPLRYKTLGLLISYLHFADKVWVNGTYVGGYGQFPPNEKSSLWGSHFYAIPEPLINEIGRNTIYIKVYCRGKSGISDNIAIGELERMRSLDNLHQFRQSIIYIFAEGGMFFTAILFLLIYIWRKKEREYLSFSFLCLASMLFVVPFFAPMLPLDTMGGNSYLFFIKSTLCEGLYLMTFCLSTFIIEFIRKRETKKFRTVRTLLLVLSSLITLAAPSYDALIKVTPAMLLFSIVQMLMGFIFVAKAIFTHETRRSVLVLFSAFIPLIATIILDIFVKLIIQKVDYPYFTLFGWQGSLIAFIILLSVKYNRAVVQNEYLNVRLKHEVLKQTREVSIKNAKLSEEIKRAETDLEMAALVQKKFFPYPPRTLRGWDIAVSYKPLDKISGDMYDYYVSKENLNGFSLFDVSGHGIAASLVTMLAKNIIYQAFVKNRKKKETVSRTLYEINKSILDAKGGIENYLTGVMFRFSEFDENDECLVEMANAGHPNPILYSAKSNICDEIESGNSEEHHGAIGLDFITVAFPQISFTMSEDDVLVFYTDGLSESTNKAKDQFGSERIKKIVKESYAKDAQSIMEDIIDELQAFTKGEKRNDDITLVVLKRENSANYIEELGEI